MTTWVENPRGGRDRGPRGLARAWVEVLVRPRRFFRNGVAPGDQAPGLVFGIAIALCYVGSLFAFVPATRPVIGGAPLLSMALALLAVALAIAPAVLHLTAALETALLLFLVPDRAGTSETVQAIAYATAPCLVAGLPIPEVRLLATAYGGILLVVGISEIHETSLLRAMLVSLPTAVVVFGYGFRGFAAASTVLAGV